MHAACSEYHRFQDETAKLVSFGLHKVTQNSLNVAFVQRSHDFVAPSRQHLVQRIVFLRLTKDVVQTLWRLDIPLALSHANFGIIKPDCVSVSPSASYLAIVLTASGFVPLQGIVVHRGL